MPDVTVTSDIDTFLKSSNNSTARTNLGAESAPTSIANKEAAYALTGVAAGTVYKTTDTGQVLERTSRLDTAWDDGSEFLIQGGTYTNGGVQELIPAGEVATAVYRKTSLIHNYGYLAFSPAEVGSELWSLYEDASDVSGTAGKWGIKDEIFAGQAQWESVEDSDTVHPADATWVALNAGLTVPTLTKTEPRNWKHDGTILVNDNDEKILLTNLPDGQQVKIVGEGGRIEQLPPSPLPDIKRGFIISSDGNPRSSTSDGGNSVSGAFFWNEADSMFVRDDVSFTPWSYYNAFIHHDGSRWYIGYQMGYFFQSDLCASTVHPADATGWTAYDSGSGIGQGTIADGALVKTRACEVYNSPQYQSSGNSLWVTIKNTVYLTVNDAASSGGYAVNGVTVANGAVQGIGWVQVGERVATTKSTILYKLSKVDGDTTFTFGATVMDMVTVGYDFILPDVLPNGGTVEIKNA